MAVDENELIELEQVIAAAEGRTSPFTELRRRFPHLALVRCVRCHRAALSQLSAL